MNDMNYIFSMMFNSLVNQAVIHKETQWKQLPQDQQEALDKMLGAIHDFVENKNKIHPQYQQQAFEAMTLKLVSEMQKPVER